MKSSFTPGSRALGSNFPKKLFSRAAANRMRVFFEPVEPSKCADAAGEMKCPLRNPQPSSGAKNALWIFNVQLQYRKLCLARIRTKKNPRLVSSPQSHFPAPLPKKQRQTVSAVWRFLSCLIFCGSRCSRGSAARPHRRLRPACTRPRPSEPARTCRRGRRAAPRRPARG